MKPNEFIALIGPPAQESAILTGIPASFTVAEAALESGWGESQLAREGKNLFGVKASRGWLGDTLTMRTREFLNGHWVIVPALWRKYNDWLHCLDDHAAFLRTNPRYLPAFDHTHDGETFAQAVAASGYASDPAYADKLIAIMRSHNLKALDAPAPGAA